MSTSPRFTVAIAGSTDRTRQCAAALEADARFQLSWVLTPGPKVRGRETTPSPNPVHQFAVDHQLPTLLLDRKIDTALETHLRQTTQPPTFLLVVDFGYLVPQWLLEYPTKACVNIHPSLLPRWRGSSPGQFVLLHGESTSAVTILCMDAGLDTGPILRQIPLSVQPNWTQTEYYQAAFALAEQNLGNCLHDYAQQQLEPSAQPPTSPTEVARRLEKADGYIPWTELVTFLGFTPAETPFPTDLPLSPLLQKVAQTTPWSVVLERASRALHPWPSLWTMVPTAKGWKRLKILEVKATAGNQLQLVRVQLEGLQVSQWNEIRNQVIGTR